MRKPLVRLSSAFVLLAGIYLLGCRFSFADSKRPQAGSIDFGSRQKPNVETAGNFAGFKTIFADVAEEALPTVVSVIPTQIDTIVFYNNPFYRFFEDEPFLNSPFDHFFGPRQRQEPQQPLQKQERRQQGIGSGVIVSEDGYILTNFHVVGGADEIEVKLADGRVYEADIVGADSLSDVAVVKIRGDVSNLPVAYLGDSESLRPGDWVIAIGNPFNLTSTVTAGIVSALGRQALAQGLPQNAYQNFIQTDAAINPGNSGGALLNIEGELVGINTMIYTRSGGYMGIGFAIPINMARWIMEDLIYEGQVNRGFLGVKIQPLDAATRDAMGLDATTSGVLIGQVIEGEPAEKAGMKRGDIVVSVNGRAVRDPNELRNVIASIDPGKTVKFGVVRNGKKIELDARLTTLDQNKVATASSSKKRPEKDAKESDVATKLGLEVSDLTRVLRQKYGLPKSVDGALITAVNRSAGAAAEGLVEGDVIKEMRIRGRSHVIKSAKQFKATARKIQKGDAIMFLVQRKDDTFFVAYRYRG